MAGRFRSSFQNTYQNLIAEYQMRIQEEKNPKPVEPVVEVESTLTASKSTPTATAESDTEMEVKSKPIICTHAGCKKKTRDSCIRSMCFLCCYETCKAGDNKSNQRCDFHYDDYVKRDKENELIEESLRAKQKERKLPRMREERFTNAGQTVVIWCFRDFCQNKKWHEDTFNAQARQLRQLRSLQKRHSYWKETLSNKDDDKNNELPDGSSNNNDMDEKYTEEQPAKKSKAAMATSSSSSAFRPIVTSRGKRCMQRYQKVLQRWQEKLKDCGDFVKTEAML